MRSITPKTSVGWFGLVLWLAGCSDQQALDTAEATHAALTAVCAAPTAAESETWTCPQPLSVECSEQATFQLPVASPTGQQCNADNLRIADPGPYAPGMHTVTVNDASGMQLCSTTITVTDTAPPKLESHTVQLWPPNHKFHDIAVEDCVTAQDACGGELHAEFMWASSDEPVDDLGDGHFAPDIMLGADCQHVSVRSERQGPKNGRVYKLGVRVVDASGNASDGVCSVIVDHDQRGVVAADSGEAYRVTFDGTQGGMACDGEPDEPPPPPTTPPANPPPPPPSNPPPTTPPSTPPMTPPATPDAGTPVEPE